MANEGLNATLGKVPGNKGGTHGNINPNGEHVSQDVAKKGSSGNPGLQNPWEGADATPKPGQVPPLRSL